MGGGVRMPRMQPAARPPSGVVPAGVFGCEHSCVSCHAPAAKPSFTGIVCEAASAAPLIALLVLLVNELCPHNSKFRHV
jgi:hypothetical protein